MQYVRYSGKGNGRERCTVDKTACLFLAKQDVGFGLDSTGLRWKVSGLRSQYMRPAGRRLRRQAGPVGCADSRLPVHDGRGRQIGSFTQESRRPPQIRSGKHAQLCQLGGERIESVSVPGILHRGILTWLASGCAP